MERRRPALWERLDPPDWVLVWQRSYDLNAQCWRMHNVAGMTLEEIARDLGVSRERVRQRVAKHERERRFATPIEAWLGDWREEIGKAFKYMPRSPLMRMDAKEIVRRARDVRDRERKREEDWLAETRQRAEFKAGEEARIRAILEASEKRRREILAKGDEEFAEICDTPVTAGEVYSVAVSMAVLGPFSVDEGDPQFRGQLNAYWRHLARGASNREVVPHCYYRLRIIGTLAMHDRSFGEIVMASWLGEGDNEAIAMGIHDGKLPELAARITLRPYEEGEPMFHGSPIWLNVPQAIEIARTIYQAEGSA